MRGDPSYSAAMTMERFSGRHALVTGGASGIGRCTALRLAEEGAAVVAVDVNAEALAARGRRGRRPVRVGHGPAG